jgi:hypothetical protein
MAKPSAVSPAISSFGLKMRYPLGCDFVPLQPTINSWSLVGAVTINA